MNVHRFPLNTVLHYRFTPWGMWLEKFIVGMMAYVFLRGNVVTWDAQRRASYVRWRAGVAPERLARSVGLPRLIVNNWITIWTAYDKAFGGFEK